MGRSVCDTAQFGATTQVLLGFTAIVNKALSAKYDKLVNDAPELVKVLPWGPAFEVDQFKKPDFTALEILHFATGGKGSQTEHNRPTYVYEFQVYQLESMWVAQHWTTFHLNDIPDTKLLFHPRIKWI